MLTAGVEPESALEALTRMKGTSDELRDALVALRGKLGDLADAWQAPSTEQGSRAILDVQAHVVRLSDHAGRLGSEFGGYVEKVGTARAQVPPPQLLDEVVRNPTPEQALWLGPLLPMLEDDLRQRTQEARQLVQDLTYAAFAVDAATPGFEPLPSQVVADPGGPPIRPGGPGEGRRMVPGGLGQTVPGPAGVQQPAPSGPQTNVRAPLAPPTQVTVQSSAAAPVPPTVVETSISVDGGRGGASGVGGGIPLPVGQSAGATGRGGGHGGQPGASVGGAPGRGGQGASRGAGFPSRDAMTGRGAGLGGGGPMGAGGRPGDDEDHVHRRAAFLHADETADELFGIDEITAPPVIGGPEGD